MTMQELRSTDKDFLTVMDIAPVLGTSPQAIRCQAHSNPAKLGFPVVIIGTRVKVPRKPFLVHIGEVTS